jgi:hypothetical protein
MVEQADHAIEYFQLYSILCFRHHNQPAHEAPIPS